MKPVDAIAAIALAALVPTASTGEELRSAPIISGGDVTIVNVFPTSPQAFVPVAGLPSYLAMPGSPPLSFATEVIYTTTSPIASTHLPSGVDVNCTNFKGAVQISGPDVFGLDKDGDGVGCEQGDR